MACPVYAMGEVLGFDVGLDRLAIPSLLLELARRRCFAADLAHHFHRLMAAAQLG